MRLSKLTIVFILFSSLLLVNCNGCTQASRARTISMAKSESRKKSTNPIPETIIKKEVLKPVVIDDIVTPKEKKSISSKLKRDKIPPAKGTLIQVEGLVLKEVTELTINLKTSSSPVDQVLMLKDHVKKNWHYIFDPKTGKDTWRSAEATLSLKYKNKYTGDCDDYAILLASFARQVGLESRVVGGFDGGAGHAFAEFSVDKKTAEILYEYTDIRTDGYNYWVSLDWFDGSDHNKYLKDIKIILN